MSFFVFWAQGLDRRLFYVVQVLAFMLWVLYDVGCVKKWGGTPGKLICGLRVVTTDLRPAGWREAWLRASVNVAFSAASMAIAFYAMAQMSEQEFSSLGFLDRN